MTTNETRGLLSVERLWRDNQRLALWYAARFARQLGGDLDEFNSVALYRLYRAARCYRPEVGSFGPYAARAIRNGLLSLLRRRRPVSLDEPSSATDGRALLDYLSSSNPTQEEAFSAVQLVAHQRAYVARLLAGMQPRLLLIVRRWMQGETLADIGARLGVSREYARQLLERALAILRKRASYYGPLPEFVE